MLSMRAKPHFVRGVLRSRAAKLSFAKRGWGGGGLLRSPHPPYELHHPGYARMKMYSCRGIAKHVPPLLFPPKGQNKVAGCFARREEKRQMGEGAERVLRWKHPWLASPAYRRDQTKCFHSALQRYVFNKKNTYIYIYIFSLKTEWLLPPCGRRSLRLINYKLIKLSLLVFLYNICIFIYIYYIKKRNILRRRRGRILPSPFAGWAKRAISWGECAKLLASPGASLVFVEGLLAPPTPTFL